MSPPVPECSATVANGVDQCDPELDVLDGSFLSLRRTGLRFPEGPQIAAPSQRSDISEFLVRGR